MIKVRKGGASCSHFLRKRCYYFDYEAPSILNKVNRTNFKKGLKDEDEEWISKYSSHAEFERDSPMF